MPHTNLALQKSPIITIKADKSASDKHFRNNRNSARVDQVELWSWEYCSRQRYPVCGSVDCFP